MWEYARKNYKREPVRFVELTERTTDEAAKRVLAVLKELQQGCDGAAPDSSAAAECLDRLDLRRKKNAARQ